MKDLGCAAITIAIWIACIAGWLNHLYVCFSEERWGFLIGGALFFPVAIVHGWGRWLGFW